MNAIFQKSCRVLKALCPQIQWLESHVTDWIYCVCLAPNEALVRKPAKHGSGKELSQRDISR